MSASRVNPVSVKAEKRKCPHCQVTCVDDLMEYRLPFQKVDESTWALEYWFCTECRNPTFKLKQWEKRSVRSATSRSGFEKSWNNLPDVVLWPRFAGRSPVPSEVPSNLAKDFTAAAVIAPDSPEAAAAMARRCLQSLIRSAGGIQKRTLHDEIDELLKGNTLPSWLADQVDAIRHLGNFGAHPEKFENTGELVPVEDDEVQWTLDVLESLFDFYFVAPANASRRTHGLNAKLKSLGKPLIKKPT